MPSAPPTGNRPAPHSRLPARLRLPAAALCIAIAACASQPSATSDVYSGIDPVSLFPMAAYDQDVDHWLDPASPDYDKPFLSADEQRAHFAALYARYFGTGANDPSPWNPAFVNARVYGQGGADIVELQRRRIAHYDNAGKPDAALGYGQNFRPHTPQWIGAIAQNMEIEQFARAPRYQPDRRAIATDNVLVRELPTTDPSFYSHRIAGEGYPFDNLQISAVRPGTPLYVLGVSKDGGWSYVQTPDVQGWVQTNGIGAADQAFVDAWTRQAQRAMGAVVAASVPVRDERGAFRFDAPAGTLLPLAADAQPGTRAALVPARNVDGWATIRTAPIAGTQIVPMPLPATPRHLAMLLKTLIGRPYGWGNTGFYNDCSSELQNAFAVFGVWLPRHSSAQMSAGSMTDLSGTTPAQRLDYLARNGQPLRTLIYIGGHVMLYLGNTTRDGKPVPVVYQDIWGLRPADNSRRAVIGGSVILPLLARIPEDPSLQSLAGTPIFQISILGAPAAAPPPPDEDNPAS